MPKRRSAAQLAARQKARELQARFTELEETRLKTATQAIALQENLAAFDAETERLVSELLAKRERRKREMLARLGAFAEEMLETRVSASEAAARMGMSLADLKAARKAFNDAVRARAESSTPPAAPEGASVPSAPVPPVGAVSVDEPTDDGASVAGVPQQSGFAGPDDGGAAVPLTPTPTPG